MPDAQYVRDDSAKVSCDLHKKCEIRARHRLELELRLDTLNQAVGARGGQVLGVSRWQLPAGPHFASVRYSLPLEILQSRRA